jgi:hypothetical protein
MNRLRASSFFVIVAGTVLFQTIGDAQPSQSAADKAAIRQALFAELRPVRLSNCTFERYGEKNDGGYLVCANLLGAVQAGYSYGISGYDGWGCDMSRKLKVKLHQYDCFDLRRPACPAGDTVFHGECVAGAPSTQDKRVFDTIDNQFRKNGDAAKRLVMKIDVEGAEWDAFAAAPDSVFQHIDQLVVEFHHNEERQHIDVVRKLKRFFYVAHVHFNNYSCETTLKPFPSWAYEVLFVNRKIGILDSTRPGSGLLPLDAPNNPGGRDCQASFP